MLKYHFSADFRINKRYYFHNLKAYTENLSIFDLLPGNNGCVNTVEWDRTGTRLLTGDDFAHIKIHQYLTDGPNVWKDELIYDQKLPNSRNILSAKYLSTENEKVICGSKCGSLFLLDINSVIPEDQIKPYFKHTNPILNLCVSQLNPNEIVCFNNGKKLLIFDIRSQDPIWTLEFPAGLGAGDFHPLDSYKLAVGCGDSFVRILDQRTFRTNMTSIYDHVIEHCRPLNFTKSTNSSNASFGSSSSRKYVSSVKFEPIIGRFLLVNYMYESIYMFDTRLEEDAVEENLVQEDVNNENDQESSRPVIVHYNWDNTGPPQTSASSLTENHSSSQVDEANQETRRRTRPELVCPSIIHNFITSINKSQEESRESNNSNSCLSMTLEDELNSVKRYKQVQKYQGAQNFRTMIKDVAFWGDNYIMSGSECGHILIWSRDFSHPVAAVPADNHVTNRISPHPFLPIIASCGLDSDIKIVASNMQMKLEDEERRKNIDLIVKTNQERTTKANNTPSISMIDLLRIMRARRILSRMSDVVTPQDPQSPGDS